MLPIDGIHHVAVICSEYERSKEFYTRVLGFTVLRETHRKERSSWKLDLSIPGGGQLELFSFPAPPARVSRPEACGLRHLAFHVRDLDACLAQLTLHRVQFEPVRIDELTSKRFTFFPDPDGLPIELYEA